MPIVKRGRIILSLLSGFLVIILLIGSTGATIILKSCKSCGVSVNTAIFSYDSPVENSCCADTHTCSSPGVSDNISSGCCTLTTENLKLTNYFPAKTFVISFISDIQPVFTQEEAAASEEQHIIPLFVHNKHGGGRNTVITNHQLLI